MKRIQKNPQHHSESPLKAVYPNPIERPKPSPIQQQNHENKSAESTQNLSPNLKKSPAQYKKVKSSTIADKLKLSLAKSPNKPSAPQQKKEEKPRTPRIVVKEIPTPTKNSKRTENINRTNSIMITKLWRGLKKEDILEYFGTFAKVIAASMTESGNEMVDGYKYMFLKFADSKAVDKVLGKLQSFKKISSFIHLLLQPTTGCMSSKTFQSR